jgi:hypothetical protein
MISSFYRDIPRLQGRKSSRPCRTAFVIFFSACIGDDGFEEFIPNILDGAFPSDDRPSVKVDVFHEGFCEFAIGGNLYDRGYGIPRGRAEPCGEKHEVGSRPCHRGSRLDVVAGCTEKRESGLGYPTRVVNDVDNRRSTAFSSGARRLYGICDQAVFYVAR